MWFGFILDVTFCAVALTLLVLTIVAVSYAYFEDVRSVPEFQSWIKEKDRKKMIGAMVLIVVVSLYLIGPSRYRAYYPAQTAPSKQSNDISAKKDTKEQHETKQKAKQETGPSQVASTSAKESESKALVTEVKTKEGSKPQSQSESEFSDSVYWTFTVQACELMKQGNRISQEGCAAYINVAATLYNKTMNDIRNNVYRYSGRLSKYEVEGLSQEYVQKTKGNRSPGDISRSPRFGCIGGDCAAEHDL